MQARQHQAAIRARMGAAVVVKGFEVQVYLLGVGDLLQPVRGLKVGAHRRSYRYPIGCSVVWNTCVAAKSVAGSAVQHLAVVASSPYPIFGKASVQ